MKFIKSSLSNWLALLATIFTILGINLSQLIQEPIQSWIVFGLSCFLILFTIVRIYLVSKNIMKHEYPNGYSTSASFFKYSTLNGIHATYEQFRYIQVKSPYKSSFEHRFHWTGTNQPKVESDLQTVGDITNGEDDLGRKFYSTSLMSNHSLIYNECDILHTKATIENDDARPFLAQNVKEPIKLLNFKIELWHAPSEYNNRAKIVRQLIDKPSSNEEEIDWVDFNHSTKSFSYTVIKPIAGYCYKIEWTKPPSS